MGNDKKWEDDFVEFLKTESHPVPSAISENILDSVKRDLNPSSWKVLAKLVFIQAFAGTASLLLCPQFGLSFTSSHGLMPYFMQFGLAACMVACGALFTGISFALASLVLKPEEILKIRSHRVLQVSAISALSLGVFICFGADVIAGFAIAWLAGSILGGIVTLEAGWKFRRFSYSRSSL